jgi:hypothetical protein
MAIYKRLIYRLYSCDSMENLIGRSNKSLFGSDYFSSKSIDLSGRGDFDSSRIFIVAVLILICVKVMPFWVKSINEICQIYNINYNYLMKYLF